MYASYTVRQFDIFTWICYQKSQLQKKETFIFCSNWTQRINIDFYFLAMDQEVQILMVGSWIIF